MPARRRLRSHAISHRSVTRLHLFDEQYKGGGFMLSQIPAFRLPETVLDEEVDYILDLGIHTHFKHYVDRLKAFSNRITTRFLSARAHRVAAICRSAGPSGRRREYSHRHQLAAAASPLSTRTRSARRVIVLGGGNTAMDCCRTARRLGGEDVKVIVRSPFATMKASPWEKEDAMHEDIPIIDNHVPKASYRKGLEEGASGQRARSSSA